jgi:hypothetical protein
MKLLLLGILLIFFGFMYTRSEEHFSPTSTASIQDIDNNIDFDKLNDATKKEITELANEKNIPINTARLLYNARKIDNSIIKKVNVNPDDLRTWPSDLEEDQKTARIAAQSKLNSFKENNKELKVDLQKIKILQDEKMRRKLKESEKNARAAIETKIKRLKKYDHNRKSDIYTKCPIAEFPYNSFDDSQYSLDVTRHSDSKWNGLDDKVLLVNKLPFNFVTH